VRQVDPATPVLAGWASSARRTAWRDAVEPAVLMAEASASALDVAGIPASAVDWIGVPEGMTPYRDPAALVADILGTRAHRVLAEVGIQQNTLIARGIDAVARGTARVAIVCGAEANYRTVKAAADGVAAPWTIQPALARPDELLASPTAWQLGVEQRTGLIAPGYYALVESALRAERGESVAANRSRIGEAYAALSRHASGNPHAVRSAPLSAEEIAEVSDENPMIAFPYPKRVISAWTVDQGGALVLCTLATLRLLGRTATPLYPVVSAEANHIIPMTARARLTLPSAMPAVAAVAEAVSGVSPASADLVDLYSCFPVAMELAAAGLGLDPRRERSIGGGMAFAGGPLNNAVLQATVRAAERVAAGDGASALVSCVSGDYTKQGLTLWSATPPDRAYASIDVTSVVAARERTLPIDLGLSGPATIVGSTVVHEAGLPHRAIAVLDADGVRTIATSEDEDVMQALMTEESVGLAVTVSGREFRLGGIRSNEEAPG
jgi:acetyl-CoA C-acetyltransferase